MSLRVSSRALASVGLNVPCVAGLTGLSTFAIGPASLATQLEYSPPVEPALLSGMCLNRGGARAMTSPRLRARSSIVIRGSVRQVKAEAKKLAAVKKGAVAYAKANATAAAVAVQKALAGRRGSEPTFSDPLPLGATIVPGWVRQIHASHKQLLIVGGIVLCPRCGSLASASKHGRLNLRCTSELAKGTARRVLLLRQGKLSGCSEFSCWPDGSSKHEQKAVHILREASDTADASESDARL